jgi:hypothetical protein
MIRHLVMWKYNEELTEAEREELRKNAAAAANDMNGKIKGMTYAALQRNVNENEPHDLALYCEFEDFASVEGYQSDPAHLAFKSVISGKVHDRVCVDCEKV